MGGNLKGESTRDWLYTFWSIQTVADCVVSRRCKEYYIHRCARVPKIDSREKAKWKRRKKGKKGRREEEKEFPRSSVVRTLSFHCQGLRSLPGFSV